MDFDNYRAARASLPPDLRLSSTFGFPGEPWPAVYSEAWRTQDDSRVFWINRKYGEGLTEIWQTRED